VQVNSVNFDAWPVLQAANEFNSPPPSGWVDVLANLSATYQGAGSASLNFDFDLNLGMLGASNVLYTDFTQSCGVSPDPNDLDFTTIYQGGTAVYNQCWQVPQADVPSLELVYTQMTNGFFALR
jgi:hypothetical protein